MIIGAMKYCICLKTFDFLYFCNMNPSKLHDFLLITFHWSEWQWATPRKLGPVANCGLLPSLSPMPSPKYGRTKKSSNPLQLIFSWYSQETALSISWRTIAESQISVETSLELRYWSISEPFTFITWKRAEIIPENSFREHFARIPEMPGEVTLKHVRGTLEKHPSKPPGDPCEIRKKR